MGRKASTINLSEDERLYLETQMRARTIQAQTVIRARILLLKAEGISVDHIADKVGMNRKSVMLCINKYLEGGVENALFDAPGRGRNAEITDDEKAWIINIACQKPVNLGYSAEVWTRALLTKHINKFAEEAGHTRLSTISQSKVRTILEEADIKPNKITYYCENRDPDFDQKMHNVLLVYKQLSLQFDEKGQLIQDDASFKQHIVDYVAQLAAAHDTVGTERQFQTTSGRTVSVYGSAYGWKIDQDGEVAQLTQEIQSGTQTTREPVYSMRANSYGVNDLGNTYIEVDLTEQYMWYYQDGNVIFESDIVSGLASDPERKTPPGIFTLYYKKSPDVLRGTKKADGTYSYEQPVTYWMPFNGGIGFHDADWQPYFGGDRYLTGGSHGCINLPYSAAKKIYETIDKGYCVLVYNLPGTESDTVKQKEATAVVNTINSIGTVTLESEPVIVAARAAYDALSDTAKSYVTNYQTLVDDEAALAALKSGAAAAAQQPAADQTAPADGSTVAPADPAAQTTDGTVAQ